MAAIELRRRLPETGVLILSQFCEPAFALELIGERPEGIGYLLKERVGDVDDVRGRGRAASRPAAARSTPRSSAGCSAPSTRNEPAARADARASARCSPRWPRASRTSASRRRSSSARPPSRSTSRHLPQARHRTREHRAPARPCRPEVSAGNRGAPVARRAGAVAMTAITWRSWSACRARRARRATPRPCRRAGRPAARGRAGRRGRVAVERVRRRRRSEACRLLGGHFTALLRYEPDGPPAIVAMWGDDAVRPRHARRDAVVRRTATASSSASGAPHGPSASTATTACRAPTRPRRARSG